MRPAAAVGAVREEVTGRLGEDIVDDEEVGLRRSDVDGVGSSVILLGEGG